MIARPGGGWRDAHLHLGAYGESLEAVDLAGCSSCAEALEFIAARAAEVGPEEWVVAIRARVEGWTDRRWATHGELHAAGGGRCVVMRSFDIHSGAVSTRVLEMAGIGRETPDPAGGRIDRDGGGEATGLLVETAWRLVDGVLPAVTQERLVERVRLACADLVERGFAEVHDMWTDLALARAVRVLEARGELGLRVGLAPLHQEMETCLADAAFAPSERVWVAGVKIFTDGTLNSRTAHMLGGYDDPDPAHPRGVALMTTEEIAGAVRDADSAGLPIIAHAIGDAAVRSCLDAIELAKAETAGQRIEHAQFVDEGDVGRFGELGVIASVQPCHLLADVEALERLTSGRLDRAFPLRDLVDGARAVGRDARELVWMGSDAPVVAPEPADNVQAAVERGREDSGVIGVGQAISEEECVGLMGVKE